MSNKKQPAKEPVVVLEEPKTKKLTYNPVAAKAYRDKLREYALKGGYVPKERKPDSAIEKRTSKTGNVYYYQPWSSLTDKQKAERLAQARERSARDREDALKYKQEHLKEK